MDSTAAPIHETVSFALTALGTGLVALGMMTGRGQVRRVGGGLLMAVGVAGVAAAWDRWSARAGRHMSILTLRNGHKQPLSSEETRWLRSHLGQLVAGALALW